LDRHQPAVEGRCYVHSGELEAGEVTKGQDFQRFQLRPTGFKPIQTRDIFVVSVVVGQVAFFNLTLQTFFVYQLLIFSSSRCG